MNKEKFFYLDDETYQTNRIESYTNLTIYNCIFNFIGREELKGGSIFLKCNMTNNITKCIFSNCFAQSGGAIFITTETDTLTYLQSCIFYNNYVLENGGSLCIIKSKILLFDCQFINNSVIKKNNSDTEKLGGAIFFNSINSNLQSCSFKNNYIFSILGSTKYRSSGGAIYFFNSSYHMNNCSFINNSLFCINSGNLNDGGAISSNFSSNITFNKCLFNNNTIYSEDDCLVTIGGGLILISCNATITGCTFTENSVFATVANSFQLGGALNLFESNSTINYCLFMQNDALQGGDILFLSQYSALRINHCTFNRKNNYRNITRSLIALWEYGDYLNFTFIGNKVKILNSKNLYAFAFDVECDFINSDFSDNCIFPFNNTLFVNPTINITEHYGDSILTFDKIFNASCYDQCYSSYFYSNSNPFSHTLEFSKSDYFSQAMVFSKSKYFTHSTINKNSNYFHNTLTKSLDMNAKSENFFTELLDDGKYTKMKSQTNSIYFEYSYQNTKNYKDKYLIIIIVLVLAVCIFAIIVIIIIMYKVKRQKRLIYDANEDSVSSFTSCDDISFGI